MYWILLLSINVYVYASVRSLSLPDFVISSGCDVSLIRSAAAALEKQIHLTKEALTNLEVEEDTVFFLT